MAFDGDSPATGNDILTDINQIREDLKAVREHEAGTSYPSNPVAGMLFWKTDTKELYIRNNANDTWILIWDEVDGFNAKAINIAYNNTTSGLSATDVKNALDEISFSVTDVKNALDEISSRINLSESGQNYNLVVVDGSLALEEV